MHVYPSENAPMAKTCSVPQRAHRFKPPKNPDPQTTFPTKDGAPSHKKGFPKHHPRPKSLSSKPSMWTHDWIRREISRLNMTLVLP